MKKDWKEYLERLKTAMGLSKEDLEEFDAQIQKDYKEWKAEIKTCNPITRDKL
jgi:tripartite-type tricarboxylate transporter receptor subunit TctC